MKPLKIGAYIRVSTEDQVNVYEGSLESQKHRISEFVEYKNRHQPGWGEIVEYYIEEGVSAGTTNRPMYQKIMADVRKKKINLILVSDLTRLSRNLLDFCTLINELESHKASYLSMKEQFDTSTPIGRMMVYIIIALGQFEREQTSERVSINCHSRALRGLVNGGPAPLGFDKHPEKRGLLIVDEDEAKIVKTIFAAFLEQGSRSKTIEKLRSMGITPKRISKRAQSQPPADWTVQSIGALLSNAAYIGYREVNKFYKDEDPLHLKPWQKYQMVKAAWPAILDEKMFHDAQKLLEEATGLERTRMAKGERRIFLLTGLVSCGETGLPMVGQAGHGKTGTIHRYYHYTRKPKHIRTVRPRLNADDIEEKVLAELRTALKTAGYFTDLEKMLRKQAEAQFSGSAGELARVETELNQINDRTRTIWENQGRMKLSDAALEMTSNELNRLATQKKELEIYRASLGSKPKAPQVYRDQAHFIEHNIRALFQGWAKATPAMKKRLLRRTIKEIVITRSEIQITFWVSADEQLDSNGGQPLIGSEQNEKILPFRRVSAPAEDRNLCVRGSGNVKNGSGGRT